MTLSGATIQSVRRAQFRGGTNSGRLVNAYGFRRLVWCEVCSSRLYGE